MSGVDGPLLPGQGGGFGSAEQVVPHKQLVQALEGKQVAVLHYLGTGPTGSRGFGLELTDGERWIVFGARSNDSRKYRAVLMWRMLVKPKIWTPARRRHFASGRDADPLLDPPDELQRYTEGQVISGLMFAENPTSKGGEEQRLIFKDGSELVLAAVPINKTIYHREPGSLEHLIADLEWELTFPDRGPVVRAL